MGLFTWFVGRSQSRKRRSRSTWRGSKSQVHLGIEQLEVRQMLAVSAISDPPWTSALDPRQAHVSAAMSVVAPGESQIASVSSNPVWQIDSNRDRNAGIYIDNLTFYEFEFSNTANTVPEPSTFMLAGLAMTVGAAWGWRRHTTRNNRRK